MVLSDYSYSITIIISLYQVRSALPYTFGVVDIEKGAFGSLSTKDYSNTNNFHTVIWFKLSRLNATSFQRDLFD